MAYSFARRQELAREKGFSGYAEQRRYRSEARDAYPTSNTRAGVALRDKAAGMIKDGPGRRTRSEIQKELGLKRQRKVPPKLAKLLKAISPKKARKGQ